VSKNILLRCLKRSLMGACVLSSLTLSSQAGTIAQFPTGFVVELAIAVDTTTGNILASNVSGLAGFVVTNPAIVNGVLVGDFGLFTAPSNQLIATDAATLGQYLLLTLDVPNFTVTSTGINVPVSATELNPPVTDPALLNFDNPLIFGFVGVNTIPLNDQVRVFVYDLDTVNAVPEPSALFLIGAGLGGLLLIRRRSA